MDNLVKLKQFRQKFQLTQSTAAERIGIDQRQWNRYENEKNEMPIRYLKAICDKFNVSADWLLGLEETEVKQMEKVNKFFEEILEVLSWAVDQGHINDEQMTLLAQNFSTAKDEITK